LDVSPNKFGLFKTHDKLISSNFASVDEIGFIEIREVFGDILEILNKIEFDVPGRND